MYIFLRTLRPILLHKKVGTNFGGVLWLKMSFARFLAYQINLANLCAHLLVVFLVGSQIIEIH